MIDSIFIKIIESQGCVIAEEKKTTHLDAHVVGYYSTFTFWK